MVRRQEAKPGFGPSRLGSHRHRGGGQGPVHDPRVSKNHPEEAWGSKTAAKGHVPGDDRGKGRPVASDQTARGGQEPHRRGGVSGESGGGALRRTVEVEVANGGQRAGGAGRVRQLFRSSAVSRSGRSGVGVTRYPGKTGAPLPAESRGQGPRSTDPAKGHPWGGGKGRAWALLTCSGRVFGAGEEGPPTPQRCQPGGRL